MPGSSLYPILFPLQVVSLLLAGNHNVQVVSAFGVEIPSSIALRASVITNTVPLSYYEANYTTTNDDELFPEFRGFQPDLLRQIVQIAKDIDNVTLSFELEESPPFAYDNRFEYLAIDCNSTSNQFTDFKTYSAEECNQWDLVIADYYGYPQRSMRATFTPPLLTTAAATIQYVHRTKRAITTLQEAETLQEPVCLLDGSHYDKEALLRFPGLKIFRCFNHDDCVNWVKEERCALFVEDELQLRHIMTQDAALEVTQEKWNEQYIVWPMNARLNPLYQQLMIRWMYEAKVSGFLDTLYDEYFSINFCPLGTAGENCDQPCDASHGTADRFGNCVCQSTRWTGADCSVETLEDKNLIPNSLVIVCYVMVGINFLAVAICGVWLIWNRNTPQVRVSQPIFLGLVLLGCVISTSTIFALAQEHDGSESASEPACMAIPWLYSVGFSITFASLFSKIRRVYLLFRAAATMTRVSVTAKETFFIVGGVLLIDVTILTVWTILDPLEWHREALTVDQYGYTLSSQGFCASEYFAIFASVIAAFHFTLMGVACYLCYVSREIPTRFSESKYVSIAMISNLQIFVVAVPVLIILGSDPQSSFFVRSVIIWMNDFAVLALVFGNLMFSVEMGDGTNDNSKVMIRNAMHTYTERRNKRLSVASRGGRGSSHLSNAGNDKSPQALRPSMFDAGSLMFESKVADRESGFQHTPFSSGNRESRDQVARMHPMSDSESSSKYPEDGAPTVNERGEEPQRVYSVHDKNTISTTLTTSEKPLSSELCATDEQSAGGDYEVTPADEPPQPYR
ncbi:acid type B receptor subunit 2 [Seminavis robusta]|uniref:Acid type B receptor subunit 2 n=1 Tax=Seminavis robusta TaxID=568900 RepID=A0A9N8EBS6_9STRA|nr:acid type B receptor subunit 2 [Seminavis robusta]|eukprot:Sro774_g200610.1 acid type B receptor subunit 2 (795) ;mRNA; r:9139-11606